MEYCSFNATVGYVALFQYEMVDPIALHFFAFKTFNKFQQSVFQFEGEAVQSIEAVWLYLVGFLVSNQSRNAFAQ